MDHTAPPDKRPYRLASAPGDERAYTQNGVRCTYRQIGWHDSEPDEGEPEDADD